MSHPIRFKTAILYQNPAKTVTLIDIPTSISLAQGTAESPNPWKLFSSPPLQAPYASTEPKSEAAKANVRKTMGCAEPEFSTKLLVEALKQIGENYMGEWCLPRPNRTSISMGAGSKRKLGHKAKSEEEAHVHGPNLKYSSNQHDQRGEVELQGLLELSPSPPYSTAIALDVESISHQLVRNPSPIQLPLHISMISQTYIIPPCAGFMFTSINGLSFQRFSQVAYETYPTPSTTAGPGQFDFILLDPPWDNHSVRRSQKYTTLDQEANPMDIIRNMLSKHIALGALVGCWITNKPSVRDTAVEAFQGWGVDIIEEWAWLKTTVHGDPMSPIGGLWRKPYEILLVGRKCNDGTRERQENVDTGNDTRKRVIVAVPDLHSRKPNLKELIKPMIPNPLDYRALELFARNLTAGWWSWGDEVLKFNWEGHWWKGDQKALNREEQT